MILGSLMRNISAEDLDAMFDSAFDEKTDNPKVSDRVSNDENSNTNQVTCLTPMLTFDLDRNQLENVKF